MKTTEKMKADLVVIGGGGAGIMAALAAAERGVSVIMLEKLGSPGGNSIYPAGPFAVDSPVQKRLGINAPKDLFFKESMHYTHWRLNPKIIRVFIDKTGDTIRWLEEKGVEFTGLRKLYPTQETPVWHMLKEVGARHLFKVLVKYCDEVGVKVLRRTPATKILTNKRGRVTGVLAKTAKTEEGNELTITTKSVVIATGGYGGNKELLKKYYPAYSENMHNCGFPHKGDGLLMAMEIGVATEGLGILQLNGPRVPKTNVITRFTRKPYNILVNKKGERFIDEATTPFPEMGNAVDRQPDKMVFALFDEQLRQRILDEYEEDEKMEMPPRERMLLEVERYKQNGYFKTFDSWEEVAKWIGADPAVLQATIHEYNSFCDKGRDAMFAKDKEHLLPLRTPPFHAIKAYSGYYNTIGGIKVNERMEVMNKKDKPIPGVFAAGVDVGGWETETYNARLSGGTFSFALNSGRIAGESAAAYIATKK